MDDSRLPKKVLYYVLRDQTEPTGSTKDWRTFIRENLSLFGLTTKDDMVSWVEKANKITWEQQVHEARCVYDQVL